MKTFLFIIAMSLSFLQIHSGTIMHRYLLEEDKKEQSFVWEEDSLDGFNELIVSWNADRPAEGSYLIQISLLTSSWSPWLDYAFWDAEQQYSFYSLLPDLNLKVYQDAIEVLNYSYARGFKIRVIASESASLTYLRSLHVSITDHSTHVVTYSPCEKVFTKLNINGLSQMALNDERLFRLCSPVSTTAAINFLSEKNYSPLEFADAIFDSKFNIYGNWVLNVAQASHLLGKSWQCYVAHLTNFQQIIDQLMNGYPVIVSIKGPIEGSATPYMTGHLIVITGYDSETQQVFCMDPAFQEDHLTHVQYALHDFLAAWNRREGIAYIFNRL